MSKITQDDINIMNKGVTELIGINGEEYEDGDEGKCYMCKACFDIETALDISDGEIEECPKCGRVFQ